MTALSLALAALFGAMVSAPAAVLAWERRQLARPLARRLLRATMHRRPHQRTTPRLRAYLVQRGAHHTPRGGTATITAEQLAAAPTPLELTA